MQVTPDYRTNRGLFSNYYLDEHLPETDGWNADEAEVRAAYEEIRDHYRRESDRVLGYDERQLRENLLDPVFEALGLTTAVEEPIRGERLHPDYVLFGSERTRAEALERRDGGRDFYADALGVADVKRWDQSLDPGSRGSGIGSRYRMHVSLDATGLDRGILTNGRKWRLYYGPTSHRLDSYYEIDLPTLLKADDWEEFKYFYLFFRRDAFLGRDSGADTQSVPARSGTDRPFVERVHRESNAFAEKLSEDLRENVYEAISVLAQGFVDGADRIGPNNIEYDNIEREIIERDDIGRDDIQRDGLDTVYQASLTYLYRLIFVLYAESDRRNLLDTDNEVYRERYSLDTLKRRVAEELDSPNTLYRACQTTLWDRLEELFVLIDRGSETRDTSTDGLYVPAYNGGLFKTDPEAGKIAAFLDAHAVGDTYLARVIELLTRRESERGEDRVFVDYSSLDVRHLGSIYEGLLEYELEVADEPLVALCDDGEEKWTPAKEVGEDNGGDGNAGDSNGGDGNSDDAEPIERVEPGDVYLTTGTGQRKTTGSYYTPEFVVEYVVERTLEPLLDDIRANLDPQNPDYADAFAERVFGLSVLDPAMGSGHFLVETVEYLTRAVAEAYQRQEAHQKQVGRTEISAADTETSATDTGTSATDTGTTETDAENPLIEVDADAPGIHWVRRQVAQRCIYGVDENEMAVELAKVSLWLRTLAAEQPLAFLDHHLECGDSLAGTDVAEAEELACDTGPNAGLTDLGSAPAEANCALLDAYREFAALESETLSDMKQMECKYAEIQRDGLRRRLTAMANVRTAERFGLDVPSEAYERIGRALDDEDEWERIAQRPWFEDAQQLADERGFLHWKLAFPEVFCEGDGSAETGSEAGFDAVLGNPPYVRSRNLPPELKEYYRREFRTAEGAYDLYIPFVELAADLGDRVSLVVPNKWTTTDYGRNLRDLLLDDWDLREILDASNLDVFPDADTYPVVVTYGKSAGGETVETDGIRVRHPEPSPPGRRESERALTVAPSTTVSKSFVDDLGGRVLPLDLDDGFADTAAEVLARCDRLGDYVTFTEGVHTGNVREKLLTDDPACSAPVREDESAVDTCHKVVDGKSVGRYRLDWDGTWLRYDESLIERDDGEYADFRDSDCFEGEKLLVRDISDRPVAVYDDENHYALNTLFTVQSREDSDLSLRYLLGVFNSEFVATYFQQVYGGTHVSGDYLRYKPMFAEQIPVPDPEQADMDARAVAEQAGVEATEVPDDPETAVATLTEHLRAARDERSGLNLDVLDHLDRPPESAGDRAGPTLAETSVPVEGVGDSVLADTATDREGLRIGEVRIREDESGTLVLSATARYKPETSERDDVEADRRGYVEADRRGYVEADRRGYVETDQWGYIETEPVTAMRFPTLGETKSALVEAFVPAAVERGEGFAAFRENATKTNSLLDRLRTLTLPDAGTVSGEIAQYREVRERVAELDERIAALEDAIDGIVYRLYGVETIGWRGG